jgi:DNA polymerase-2
VTANAVKILMNSFYGVLGTPSCRFFDPRLANAITEFGRTLLVWARDEFEAAGLRVLYGDTDSLFVASGESDPEAARARGRELARWLDRRLADHVRATWGVESRLELEFEKLYTRLFLPPVRGGGAGAMKRYAGRVDDGGECRIEYVGLEVVRRDWTALARRIQRGLYERLFADREVASFLARTVADLRAGRLDDELVYRKALRKRLDSYTATTPPHVAAARKMTGPVGRTIEYVMTADGPEPTGERRHPYDYEHYVARQIRPVAEPVLSYLQVDFKRAIGDDRQLGLFG